MVLVSHGCANCHVSLLMVVDPGYLIHDSDIVQDSSGKWVTGRPAEAGRPVLFVQLSLTWVSDRLRLSDGFVVRCVDGRREYEMTGDTHWLTGGIARSGVKCPAEAGKGGAEAGEESVFHVFPFVRGLCVSNVAPRHPTADTQGRRPFPPGCSPPFAGCGHDAAPHAGCRYRI